MESISNSSQAGKGWELHADTIIYDAHQLEKLCSPWPPDN